MRNPLRKRLRRHAPSRKQVLSKQTPMVALYAYSQDDSNWREWTFRTISERKAAELVKDKQAVEVKRKYQGIVQIVGYRATEPVSIERASPSSLTANTTRAVAESASGQRGLARQQVAQVERYRVWGLVHDTKAVLAKRRMSVDEEEQAMNLLQLTAAERAKIRSARGVEGGAAMVLSSD